MALFRNYQDFALHTMNEYLTMAKVSMTVPKEKDSGGCYGMAALLLLSSVIDTLGSFYPNKQYTRRVQQDVDNKKVGGVEDHFGDFCKKFISDDDTKAENFKKNFYKQGRCATVHNSALRSGILISIDKNVPMFNADYTTINIAKLYDKVEDAFNTWVYDTYHSNDVLSLLKEYSPIPDTGTTQNNVSLPAK